MLSVGVVVSCGVRTVGGDVCTPTVGVGRVGLAVGGGGSGLDGPGDVVCDRWTTIIAVIVTRRATIAAWPHLLLSVPVLGGRAPGPAYVTGSRRIAAIRWSRAF